MYEGIVYLVGLHREILGEIHDACDVFPFVAKPLVTVGAGQSKAVRPFGQTHVGIVLPEQNAVFSSRRKHTVRLVHSLCHQVVDKDTDIGFVASQNKRLATMTVDVCVDAGNDALAACLFISGSAVHLSGKEQVLDDF